MLSVIHPNQTRRLADSQDEYNALSISDETHEVYGNIMSSIWEPTPAELAILNQGGFVRLSIVGVLHPPVLLTTMKRIED